MVQKFRITAILIMIFAIIITYIPVTAYATPNTHPNTHQNTGDQRADVIAIALTQVGYMEGANNDTKYGVWYGYNNIAWCGIFVAWCADQAGVPTSVLKRTGIANPASYGLTAEPSGYIPKSGDLFFTFNNTHVGFVYYVEGEYFYSLEGNTCETGPEGVYIRKHRIDSKKYASPKYQGGGSHNYVRGNEQQHPHKEFYSCTDCNDKYYSGKTAVNNECTICIQSNCSHNFSKYSRISDSQHSRKCSLCQKEETASHNWRDGAVTQQATCNAAGSKNQSCTDCDAARTIYIAATGIHNYTQWQYKDEGQHSRKCQSCGKEEIQNHNTGNDFKNDENSHWYECAVCNEKLEEKKHSFGDSCESPCEVCEYIRADGHRYSEKMRTNSKEHWLECEVCGIEQNRAEHRFSTDCDETCDDCGYTRITTHEFSEEYSTDLNGHWFTCSVCGAKNDEAAHSPETGKRQGAIISCTVCQLVLTSEAMHTHGYDEVSCDENSHWGTCSCGIVMEQQPHQWSVKTEVCTVCSQPMPQRQNDTMDLLPWVGFGSGVLVIGILLIILLLKKK